jgi:hypothetical protein
MKIEQRRLSSASGWRTTASTFTGEKPQLAFVFGPRRLLENSSLLTRVRETYPRTQLVFASGAGEFSGAEVSDDQLVVTALTLEKAYTRSLALTVAGRAGSHAAGRELGRLLNAADLTHVFVLCDGVKVNGSQLVEGLSAVLPAHVSVTGGLAGDGMDFHRTIVGLDANLGSERVVATGFYGADLRVAHGCSGGWAPYGDECVVTRAEENMLFELDGKPALQRYCEQLGEEATALPLSTMRFPVHMVTEPGAAAVVRASHLIDRETGMIEFAGDISTGAHIRFLRATHDDLIGGAVRAAQQTNAIGPADLVLCVDCIGRRVVLDDAAIREIQRMHAEFPPHAVFAGFYSYGEIAPPSGAAGSQFHNQTVTITALREV